ncbi:MAG: hypothetical protein KIT59_03665 [Nitrosomonas sp.]|nr:hypothetical protein [Nitrosomonas sp.]
MIKSLLIGMGGMVLLMAIWVIVQYYWGKTFSHELSDEDVLASRNSCGHCGCTSPCETRPKQSSMD